jgi:transcriptional regulator with XRE-family HTH domain
MYPNLKLEIFKRGIRQNNLARELGMNEANLSKIIRGYREPSGSQRQLLAQYLGVDESWLFEKYERRSLPTQPLSVAGPQATKIGES